MSLRMATWDELFELGEQVRIDVALMNRCVFKDEDGNTLSIPLNNDDCTAVIPETAFSNTDEAARFIAAMGYMPLKETCDA